MEIIGLDNIPDNQSIILAPNHQNAFIDAIIVGALLKGKPHFLARSDVFVSPFDKVLDALNMMPIYRIRDGYDKLAKNDQILEKCKNILLSKGKLLIFPEGNFGPDHFLRPLSKGTARLALQTQDEMDSPLYLIPVGLNFFDHNHPRTKLVVHFGQSIDVSQYLSDYQVRAAITINQLKSKLTEELKSVMILPDQSTGYDEKVAYLKQISRTSLSYDNVKETLEAPDFEFAPINNASNKFLRTLFGIPNYPVLQLCRWVLSHVVKDPQFTLSIKFVFCLFIFPLYWLLIFCLFAWQFGWVIALFVLVGFIASLFIRQDL